MRVIVCIKQVPDTTNVRINPETNTLVREGVASIINPFDVYAIEEAVRLKEKYGGTVTVITMGPPQASEALREAIGLGADNAYLVSDRAFAGADTLATAFALACAIRHLGGADVIFMGRQAIDGDTGQVGPGVAENLDISHVTDIRKIEEIADGRIVVERLLEDGLRANCRAASRCAHGREGNQHPAPAVPEGQARGEEGRDPRAEGGGHWCGGRASRAQRFSDPGDEDLHAAQAGRRKEVHRRAF